MSAARGALRRRNGACGLSAPTLAALSAALPDDRPPLLLSAAAVAPARASANADLAPVRRYAPPMVERRAGEPNALGWSAERRESREDVADGQRERGEFERMLSAVQQADAAALDEAALYPSRLRAGATRADCLCMRCGSYYYHVESALPLQRALLLGAYRTAVAHVRCSFRPERESAVGFGEYALACCARPGRRGRMRAWCRRVGGRASWDRGH